MTVNPPPGYRNAPLTSFDNKPVDQCEAEEFIWQVHRENPKLGEPEPRLDQIRTQIDAIGTYAHTRQELVYGARMAWRNASRCIGRVYWNSLVVRDHRGTTGCAAHGLPERFGGRAIDDMNCKGECDTNRDGEPGQHEAHWKGAELTRDEPTPGGGTRLSHRRGLAH